MNSSDKILVQLELLPAAKKVYTGNEKQIFGEDILQHLSKQWKYRKRWFFCNDARIIRIDTLKAHLKKS
jgi:hypothetical protein